MCLMYHGALFPILLLFRWIYCCLPSRREVELASIDTPLVAVRYSGRWTQTQGSQALYAAATSTRTQRHSMICVLRRRHPRSFVLSLF